MGNTQRILPEEGYWMDRRLTTIYHNQFAYSAEPPETLEECIRRREFTREQVTMAAGLSPMPERTHIHAEIWGHFKHEGTVIAKVRFESMPGLIVTGNLFLPERIQDKAPGILCPHGHWQYGRINDEELGSVPRRCMMLARLGFVVFCYDMVGYNDNNQIMHRWPEAILREAALSGAGMFGLQTWNSIRALDFLCDLPQVDENKIGCTGASGGGSQTWTIAVLDDRIKVLAPVCMLSSHFQGGCQCEEGPLLRLNGITSFDVLAACAPRPLLLPTCTRDWTHLDLRYEIPALRKVYALYNATDAIKGFRQDEEHNYNQYTRERVYPWFTHWLLNQSLRETVQEDELTMPPLSSLLITEPPVLPTEASTKACLEKITAHLRKPAMPPVSKIGDLAQFRQERVNLLGAMVNNDQNLKDIAVRVTCPSWELGTAKVQGCLISRRDVGDIIPAVDIRPAEVDPEKPVCLLLAGNGKVEFFSETNHRSVLDTLLTNKCRCLVPDLLGSGETLDMPGKSLRNESLPDFFAFNPSLYSMRVQDILTCIQTLREDGCRRIALVVDNRAARTALCALAIGEPVDVAVIDMAKLEDSPREWLGFQDYQPMILKIGGMRGMAALANVGVLAMYNPDETIEGYVTEMSHAAGIPGNVTIGRSTWLRLVEYAVCKVKNS